MCVPLWQSKLRRHSLPKITVRLTIQNLSQFRRVNEFIISTRHIWSPDFLVILIKWFNYKKIVLKFPILCGYWRYHLIFFQLPRARVFLFRFLINEFCELVAHFRERSETFSVKAVVQTVKLLACITGWQNAATSIRVFYILSREIQRELWRWSTAHLNKAREMTWNAAS